MNYTLLFTPGFRPRFQGCPLYFIKKFSLSECSVWLKKCGFISVQVLSSWTILANRLSYSFVSSLSGFYIDIAM
jgi:hypothetical protein